MRVPPRRLCALPIEATVTSTVCPAVENGAIALQIELDQPAHPGLRTNHRVGVPGVGAQKENVLSMPRGSIGFVDGHETIFAIPSPCDG